MCGPNLLIIKLTHPLVQEAKVGNLLYRFSLIDSLFQIQMFFKLI